jgi:hypothetical protein
VLPGTVRAANDDHFPIAGEGRTYHDLSSGNAGTANAFELDTIVVSGP